MRRSRRSCSSCAGDIQQVPSTVSAIKVDGKRAYARARAGEDVQLAARPRADLPLRDHCAPGDRGPSGPRMRSSPAPRAPTCVLWPGIWAQRSTSAGISSRCAARAWAPSPSTGPCTFPRAARATTSSCPCKGSGRPPGGCSLSSRSMSRRPASWPTASASHGTRTPPRRPLQRASRPGRDPHEGPTTRWPHWTPPEPCAHPATGRRTLAPGARRPARRPLLKTPRTSPRTAEGPFP